MSGEEARGCGYRQVGGLYLVGSGFGVPCDRLPVEIAPCPGCGFAPAQTRSFAWVSGRWLGDHRVEVEITTYEYPENSLEPVPITRTSSRRCPDSQPRERWGATPRGGVDPICVASDETRLLMWVGARFYSPGSFTEEAERLGISKRISDLPAGLVLGRTWVLLAHPEASVDRLTWGLRWLFGDGEVLPAPRAGRVHSLVRPRRPGLSVADTTESEHRLG